MPADSKQATPLTPAQAIEKITDHETRLTALEAAAKGAPTATLHQTAGNTPGQNASAEAVLVRLTELGVHPGLCASKTCTPCRTSATQLIRATRASAFKEFMGELNTAATLGNVVKEADAVATAWEKWTAAGRPAIPPADKDAGESGTAAKTVTASEVDELVKLGE